MRASMYSICKTVSNLCICIFHGNYSGKWMHVEKTLIYSTHSKGSKLTNQRTKVVKIIKLYRLILKYKPTGLKALLESWISVDIDNFLLVNILQRHLEQKLFSLLSSIDWFQKIDSRVSRLAWRVGFLSISITFYW